MSVWLLLAALGTDGGPSESITVDDRIEYYRIEGRTARELVAQMELLGPVGSVTGRRAAGYTQSEVVWEHSHEMREGACQLNYLDVSVTIVITLPGWVRPRRAPPALVAQWKGFMANLREHEATHRQHGLQAAVAVRQAILAMPPHADCRSLERAIGKAARQEIRRYVAAGRKYDALTDYGAKQGVRLHLEPPSPARRSRSDQVRHRATPQVPGTSACRYSLSGGGLGSHAALGFADAGNVPVNPTLRPEGVWAMARGRRTRQQSAKAESSAPSSRIRGP